MDKVWKCINKKKGKGKKTILGKHFRNLLEGRNIEKKEEQEEIRKNEKKMEEDEDLKEKKEDLKEEIIQVIRKMKKKKQQDWMEYQWKHNYMEGQP